MCFDLCASGWRRPIINDGFVRNQEEGCISLIQHASCTVVFLVLERHRATHQASRRATTMIDRFAIAAADIRCGVVAVCNLRVGHRVEKRFELPLLVFARLVGEGDVRERVFSCLAAAVRSRVGHRVARAVGRAAILAQYARQFASPAPFFDRGEHNRLHATNTAMHIQG